MGNSGYVDWHRLDRTLPWVKVNQQHHTYVYAFWLADYGTATSDHGVSLFKAEGAHPDWFIHAQTADQVLAAYQPASWFSPNHRQAYGPDLAAYPLLGCLLLGTADAMYMRGGADHPWWCDTDDLVLRGRLLLKQMSHLYEREAVLVTFLDRPTDENSAPEVPGT